MRREEILHGLDLPSLETKSLRWDQTETFKRLKDPRNIGTNYLFEQATDQTARGSRINLR